MLPHSIIELAEIGSTNEYARVRLCELVHGDVIHAQIQTAGRGRWQRAWVSHVPGNLCLTFVLKPEGKAASDLPLASLSQLLAVSLCRVLDSFQVQPTLKWPNDIQVNGQKIAGILAEAVFDGAKLRGLLLGIGVNLNLDAHTLAFIDQPATSLSVLLRRPVDVPAFRDALTAVFFNGYEEFIQTGFRLIRDEYISRCRFIGQTVEIRWPTGSVCGRVRTVDDEGALEIINGSGEIQAVSLGEMFAQNSEHAG